MVTAVIVGVEVSALGRLTMTAGPNTQFSQNCSVFLEDVGGHQPREGVAFHPLSQQNRAVIRRLRVRLESRDTSREYGRVNAFRS